MEHVALHHGGALFRRLTPAEAYWEVAPNLIMSPAAEWALSQFFPDDLRTFFLELGVIEILDQARLSKLLKKIVRPPPVRTAGDTAGQTAHAGARIGRFNEIGLSAADLVGHDAASRGVDGALASPDDPIQAVAFALADLRGGLDLMPQQATAGGSSSSSSRQSPQVDRHSQAHHDSIPSLGIDLPARPARSLRLRAQPPRRLVEQGVIRMPSARGSFTLLASHEAVGIGQTALNHPSLPDFAELLGTLALDVFQVPLTCLKIVVEHCTRSPDDCGCLGQRAPLLFTWNAFLSGNVDPGFWFSEFCHALAHRAVGEGHMGSSHLFAMEVLLAWHLPAYCRRFLHQTAGQVGHSRG